MNAYAISLFEEEDRGRSMVVGLYGRDWEEVVIQKRAKAQSETVTWSLIVCAVCRKSEETGDGNRFCSSHIVVVTARLVSVFSCPDLLC